MVGVGGWWEVVGGGGRWWEVVVIGGWGKLFEMKENNLVQIMSLFRSDKIIFTHI